MKKTQRDLVVDYIRDFGSISSWEAYQELGITQLGARIFELKERGYVFHKDKETKRNRYGKIIFEGGTKNASVNAV